MSFASAGLIAKALQAIGGGLGWSIMPATMPVIAKELGLGHGASGFIFGAASLGIALASPVGGAAVDRFGARRVAGIAMLAGALSMGFSLWLTREAQAWAFFGMPTRIWEFALGGGLAMMNLRDDHNVGLATLLQAAGLLVIGLAAALIVATLLVMLLRSVASIERSVGGLLSIAGNVAGNTANIPQLEATAPVLAQIVDEAVVQDGYMNALTDGYGGSNGN